MFGMSINSKESRTAFSRSFLKGLAAPVMLFDKRGVSEIKPVPHIKLEEIVSSDGLAKDARVLAGDFTRALDKTK